MLKKKMIAIAISSMIYFGATAQTIDIARNKPVNVFPVITGNNPKHLVDGDVHTIFVGHKYTPVNWISVDLEDIYTIDRILLRGFRGLDESQIKDKSQKPKEHIRIWVSNNKHDSTEVFSGVLPAEKLISFKPVKARKVVLEYSTNVERPMGELEIYAYEPMPVMVNQSGYNTHGYKRFTAPNAVNGSEFNVIKLSDKDSISLFKGTISGNIGDFSSFQPSDSGPYLVKVYSDGHIGKSFPFNIEPYLIERVSYTPAMQFMIDNRCWYGCTNGYTPTNDDADCPALGVAWRDSHQFSFELQALINMYFANPDAFSIERMPLEGIYSGLRHKVSDDTPEIVRLIHWAVDIYMRGKVNHTLLKEQLAYFLYSYPELERYIPRELYTETLNYLFAIWGNNDINRWRWHDIEHTGDLFQTYTIIGTGKGQFPPGHSIIPNLMMYEVAKREKREDAERYFEAAYKQTEWLINHLDWNDPLTTKGQRMTEWVTIDALAYFYNNYPKSSHPPKLFNKIESWANVAISRSDNMWDMRKYSSDKFVIPDILDKDHSKHNPDGSFNEPGNIAGFGAAALQAAAILKGETAGRLKQISTAQMDNVFGRNPTNRHYSYNAIRDFDGADLGWFQDYENGAAQLHTVRGVLDDSPKEEVYPFNPYGGDPGHTEGWVTYQTAWMQCIAQASKNHINITLKDALGNSVKTISPLKTFQIELGAPLNFDIAKREKANVRIYRNGVMINTLQLKEDCVNALTFSTEVVLDDMTDTRWNKGDVLRISYGYAHMEVFEDFKVN